MKILSRVEFKFGTNIELTLNVREMAPNRIFVGASSLKNLGRTPDEWHNINIFIDHLDDQYKISARLINGETLKAKKLKKFLGRIVELLFIAFECEKGEFEINEN